MFKKIARSRFLFLSNELWNKKMIVERDKQYKLVLTTCIL